MSLSRAFPFAMSVLLLAALAGCASPSAIYGDRARYSPAYRGYVMAVHDGSDDPGKDETMLLLRDPVTGTKLRCREDVVEWRELHEDVAVDAIRDRRAAIASVVTTSVVFGPLVSAQPLGGLLTLEWLHGTGTLYKYLRTKDAEELLADGIQLYERARYPQSSLLFEHALAKDGTLGVHSKVYYYLGLAYIEQDRRDRAELALTAFLDRAAVRDVDGYRKAEATLESLGVERRQCTSTEPVDLRW